MWSALRPYRSWLLSLVLSWPILAFGIALRFFDSGLPPWARSMFARILGTHEDVLSPLASIVALLFILLAVVLQMVVANFGMSMTLNKMIGTVNGSVGNLATIVNHIMRNGPPNIAQQQLDDLRATLQSEVRDAEVRLRGEWRFVAGVVIAVVLAAFFGALATR